MKILLARILCSAAHAMWQKEPTLGNYTSQTFQHELNLSFHFAAELRNWFPWLDCDVDVAKAGGNFERPDIILHRRASHALNFLVIEIKREQARKDVPEDLKQIRNRWFAGHLVYRFGAAVILEDDAPEFEAQVLSRQQIEEPPFILRHTNMGAPLRKPNFSQVHRKTLSRTIDRFLEAKAFYANASEQELDKLVYALYGLTPEKINVVEGAAK